MSTEENKAIFRRVMEEAFSRGNLAALDSLMSQDFIEHEAGPGQGRGLEGVKTIVVMARTAFPDLHATIEDMTAEGDKSWARVTFRGSNTGDFMGRPPTGRSVTYEAIDICRYANGKMVEHWGVVDMLGMMQQLGLVSPPGPGGS
jgi:predicted ester cyclase